METRRAPATVGLLRHVEDSFRDRGLGSRHPTALTAYPSRALNASMRPLPPPPQLSSRAARRGKTSRRLAMARGGDTDCAGQSETSASGAAAIALPGFEGLPGDVECHTLVLRAPKSRSPSPRSLPPSLGCPPPQLAMLEHLSSLPMQMDYKGQKLAEQMFQGIILFSALTLPPWPIYRRHPLKWLPVQDSSTEDKKPGERKIKRHAKNN
ncbi:signal peptidase complex subunit 1 isoform X2 [Cebus imitator]|uniref:signal peptidase complex subunit 1 isoform X2 n=1 Tax=Cebus imitator TaxID=2715852 RepID=UPI00189A6E18|nr:signal peptidase complex subunit 1 isoform X2 [Cebus imitator]